MSAHGSLLIRYRDELSDRLRLKEFFSRWKIRYVLGRGSADIAAENYTHARRDSARHLLHIVLRGHISLSCQERSRGMAKVNRKLESPP